MALAFVNKDKNNEMGEKIRLKNADMHFICAFSGVNSNMIGSDEMMKNSL